jgi:N utilization substance protein B
MGAEESVANLCEREPQATQAEYAQLLIRLVLEHRQSLDTTISEHAIDWQIDRMSRVDLNILRMAAAEMLYVEDIVDNVAINEAIELAKEYSTPKSSKFINGILGALSQAIAK